ncbi:hypothetical protein [Chiayiivirga flava]|uniref:Uncharacterized protein n=1 Tax=Chiayiivirga flava TaxID=659595 RepID=A0A7W8D4Y3_9GAMM|nr:hypothetical protein [Chiayiivirga flava]MBB5206880.1 hypothetical protein [Chiayiivirga flava]
MRDHGTYDAFASHGLRAAFILVLLVASLAPTAQAATWVPDPAFHDGLIGADAFAGSSTRDYFGQKLVLKDGDVIAAGVVPALSGDLGALGLVRYDSAGVRQPWSNPGANGHYGNQYVVLPNGSFNRITGVRDLIAFGSRLFVLVETERYVLGNPLENPGIHFHGYGVDVVVFGTDGSFKSATEMDFDNEDPEARTVWAGGIAAYDNGQFPAVVSLVYAGRKKIDGVERPAVRRFTVESGGTLTSAYAVQHPTFGSNCSATTHCSVFGIALGGRSTFTTPPRIYLVGSRFSDCTGICYHGWQTTVMRVDSNAQPVTSFGSNGLGYVQFQGGSRGRAIAVSGSIGVLGEDAIYVASEVDLSCAMGIGVSKFSAEGYTVAAFGNTYGGTRYAGSTAAGSTCSLQNQLGNVRDSFPTGIALNGDTVAVSSYAVGGPGVLCPVGQPCPEDRFDGEAGVIATADGALLSHQRYPFTDSPGGARTRHSAFHDIAAGDGGSFSLVGGVRYLETDATAAQRGRTQFGTLRIVPSPLLFRDGFE